MAIPTSMAEVTKPSAEEVPAEVPEAPVEETATEAEGSLETFTPEEVDELISDGEEEELSEPEPEPEPEPEETPAEEEPAPTEPEPEPPAEEEEPEPELEIPETPKVSEEPKDTRTPEEVTAEITKARETAHEKLIEQFKMTEEQEEAFSTDPGTVLAKMAADLYLDLYDSMMGSIQKQMPSYVAALLQAQNVKQSQEQAFFKAWPKLAKSEYRATIDRIADTYKTQNPKASNEDAIREIGAQAWVALRLPLDELLAVTQPKLKHGDDTPTSTVEHMPAGTGAARGNEPAPRRLNEYEQLAEEFISDDIL